MMVLSLCLIGVKRKRTKNRDKKKNNNNNKNKKGRGKCDLLLVGQSEKDRKEKGVDDSLQFF